MIRPGKCVVCEKPCQPWERNTDGTYIHAACSKAAQKQ